MNKLCFRSRRYQIVIFIIVILSIIYYFTLHNGLESREIDITRRYIEQRIQEALKEEKGTGCVIPKLDPFAKEVTQFDKILPKVVCNGQDWVKCYLSECKVVPSILEITENIRCTYKDIIYDSDIKYHLGPPTVVKGSDVYVLTKSDHVKIACSGKHVDNFLPSRWSGHAAGFRAGIKTATYKEHPYNILILGFDSTSKNGFIRRMPKSYKFLVEELNAVILDGYNILGDGTPAALFPILTGKTELELPDARRSKHTNKTLDDMPFIFYKLNQKGYRTAYFEDMPWIGTFQYRFVGFKRQPADHYLRSFFLEESGNGKIWWKNKMERYCVGDTPRYSLMLNLTEQFFKLDRNKFCFTFIADITHDDFNMISTADDDFSEFLLNFKKNGHLDNTLLFVMGDHGPRYANVRDTLQGKLEERLPLMALIFPPSLQREATRMNSQTLTTPRDIHATVMDVLGWTYEGNYKVKGADLPVALSLLEQIPKNRSCSEAGIEPHWCACLSWAPVAPRDRMYRRVALGLVGYINALTEPQRAVCAPRTLTSIEWVNRQRAKEELLKFAAARDADGYVGAFTAHTKLYKENFQAKIVVGPGKGIYEASTIYHVKEDKFEFNVREISRTNAHCTYIIPIKSMESIEYTNVRYGNEPSCISDIYPHLNMYCHCKD